VCLLVVVEDPNGAGPDGVGGGIVRHDKVGVVGDMEPYGNRSSSTMASRRAHVGLADMIFVVR
jgi:hypothetical protein